MESSAEFDLDEWEQDIQYLTNDCNKVDYLNVYTQALIHSNLFDSNVNKNHLKLKNILKFPILTLKQMVDCRYKKPFVCFYDEETGTNIVLHISTPNHINDSYINYRNKILRSGQVFFPLRIH